MNKPLEVMRPLDFLLLRICKKRDLDGPAEPYWCLMSDSQSCDYEEVRQHKDRYSVLQTDDIILVHVTTRS